MKILKKFREKTSKRKKSQRKKKKNFLEKKNLKKILLQIRKKFIVPSIFFIKSLFLFLIRFPILQPLFLFLASKGQIEKPREMMFLLDFFLNDLCIIF